MATTKGNLDIQSDKVMTEPRIQTRMEMRDVAGVQKLFIDWDEPVGADRTVNFEDPGSDDTVCYLNKAQVFQNKQITTVPAGVNDIPNKTYVDTTVSGAVPPTATAGSGGATEGTVTADSDKGLNITAGVMEVKLDGVTLTFNGAGEVQGGAAPPVATAASGGGVQGKVTFDSDKGLDIAAGVGEVKIDADSVIFNPSGQLESTGIRVLATVTGIDSKATPVTNLYTVPAGKTALLFAVPLVCTAATAIAVAASAGVGVAAGEDDIFPSQALTNLKAVNDVFNFPLGGHAVVATAGQIIKLGIDTFATGTSQTLTARVVGILF